MAIRGVRYVSLAEHSGYGIAGQSYLLALHGFGVPVTWSPLVASQLGYQDWIGIEGARDWIERLSDSRLEDSYFGATARKRLGESIDYDTVVIHTTPEHWPRLVETGKHNIGYTVWETDTPPPQWISLLRSVDQVLVPSQFSREVFERAEIGVPVSVVPHIVRSGLEEAPLSGLNTFGAVHGIDVSDFIFYTIEAWTARKALWKTVRAYLEAFSGADSASLIIKTDSEGPRSGAEFDNHPTSVLVQEIQARYPDPARVILIDRRLNSAEIDFLHHIGDCYVSLTHSEGWGLSSFDAAATGNPVVITGWGGHLDFLGSDWPYLIDYELVPVIDARGRDSYLPTQKWASPSIDHAVRLIREVYDHREQPKHHAADLAMRIQRDYDQETVGRLFLAAINRDRSREVR